MNKLLLRSALSALTIQSTFAAVPASSASSSGSSGTSTSVGSGSLNITQDDFIKAWTDSKQYLPDPNIKPPTSAQFNSFIRSASTAGGISTKTELAMFLAETMWESGGLIYKSDLSYNDNNCAGAFVDSVGLPGKCYYRRGYVQQLVWSFNYKEASRALYNDDRLLQNPEQVATNEDYAWDVSFWYWKTYVKPALKNSFKFGLATKTFTQAIECSSPNTDKAVRRYKIYAKILKVFEPTATPVESGCYN